MNKRDRLALSTLLFFGVFMLCSFILINFMTRSMRQVRIRKDSDGVYLSTSSDTRFVVTHLLVGSSKAAAVDPPRIQIDSNSVWFTYDEIRKMKWIDVRGEKTTAPGPEDDFRAAIFIPDQLPLTLDDQPK